MCGGCRVTVGGETKFVCVDGPEFDGHKVDFENMMIRMRAFKTREDADHHKCHIGLGLPPHAGAPAAGAVTSGAAAGKN
jgi:ferredoxin--NADP+ reductase